MKNFIIIVMTIFVASCANKTFKNGSYDSDVTRENLLNDRWSETDMQQAVKTMVSGINKSSAVAYAKRRPTIVITSLQNKTSEHIDTQSIMDMLRVELSQSGRVQFIDKAARQDILDEYDYHASGTVSQSTLKSRGQQIGADLILNGRMDSIVQQVGSKKTVYYKLTLNMTNLSTGIIEWTDHKQFRKIYERNRLGR